MDCDCAPAGKQITVDRHILWIADYDPSMEHLNADDWFLIVVAIFIELKVVFWYARDSHISGEQADPDVI